jgi:hypothetical protein
MSAPHKSSPRRRARGLALVVVLSMVVLLTVLVSFAITVSNQDRGYAGTQISNTTVNAALESSLQYGRELFASNYISSNQWSTYLSLNYSGIPTTVPAGHNELIVPSLPSGFTCVVYARDDIDEPPGQGNPNQDNNLRIFVGAVCQTPDGKTGELSAPLEYNPTSSYTAQGSGGNQGVNNYSRQQGYR